MTRDEKYCVRVRNIIALSGINDDGSGNLGEVVRAEIEVRPRASNHRLAGRVGRIWREAREEHEANVALNAKQATEARLAGEV